MIALVPAVLSGWEFFKFVPKYINDRSNDYVKRENTLQNLS